MKKLLYIFFLSFSLINADTISTDTKSIEEEVNIEKIIKQKKELEQNIIKNIEKLNNRVQSSTKNILEKKEITKENTIEKLKKYFKIIKYIVNPIFLVILLTIYYKKWKEYREKKKKGE
ncbi:hypothetical protein [Fusobacterium sp. SYSU M8D902]|uniref:hypothetical protein n=1 Tax=Fusobacterium sp. SYSU M8D902 TaxID=3159562 RepID=UPI0032E36F51